MVDVDRRVNCFRDVNSMTLREQIVSNLKSGRKFFYLRALFDRPGLPPQIRWLSGARSSTG